MGRSFNRQELYNLVWARPRTALAKELGVSDVWIGKQCRSVHIPMPPPGYWARAQHGKTSQRPPLPIRLPGHPCAVSAGDSPLERRWGQSQDPTEPIVPPQFDEEIDAQVEAAVAMIGKVIARRDLSQPHRSLSRILSQEAQRRAKVAEKGGTFDEPQFDDAIHQRQLRLFNSLSWALDRASVSAEVVDNAQWIRGLGTVHHLGLRLDFGGTSLGLRFLEPSSSAKVLGEKPPTTTTLRAGQPWSDLPTEQWCDRDGSRLEQQLSTIVRALLHRAERDLRQEAQRQYDWRLERHQEYLKELERQREEAERKRLAAIEARRKKLRDGIISLAHDARVANEIRKMVSSLEQHPDLQHNRPAIYEAWRTEALALADHMDPMKQPLAALLGDVDSSAP